jgi:hypothetical protein
MHTSKKGKAKEVFPFQTNIRPTIEIIGPRTLASFGIAFWNLFMLLWALEEEMEVNLLLAA